MISFTEVISKVRIGLDSDLIAHGYTRAELVDDLTTLHALCSVMADETTKLAAIKRIVGRNP